MKDVPVYINLDPTSTAYVPGAEGTPLTTSAIVAAMRRQRPTGIATFAQAPAAQRTITDAPAVGQPAPVGTTFSQQTREPVEFRENSANSASQQLLENAFSNRPVNHWLDGVGRVAQAISGTYLRAQEDKENVERQRAVANQIRRHDPDLADLYAISDNKDRAAIATQFRSSLAERQKEMRAQQRARELGQSFEGADTPDEVARRALASGNPKLVESVIEGKLRRAGDRTALDNKVNQHRDLLLGGRDINTLSSDERISLDQRARAMALGVPLETLPGNEPSGQYISPWETARTPDERKALFADATRTHHETVKAGREQVAQARRTITALETAERAINGGAYTGAFSEQVTTLRKIGVALGMDLKGVKDNEIINSIANDLAKGARQGYPGAVSNFEMQTYLASVVSGKNTPEGNKAILDYLRENAKEAVALDGDMREWTKHRRGAGKPVLFDEAFAQFQHDRATARSEARSELRARAQAAAGFNPDGSQMTRQQRLEAAPAAPQAAAQQQQPDLTPKAGMTAINRRTGERLVFDGERWNPAPTNSAAGEGVSP
jgi:hypothetical protein